MVARRRLTCWTQHGMGTIRRPSLDLTGEQEGLVEAVAQTGKPTIVVLVNGRPLADITLQGSIEVKPAGSESALMDRR
jgi:hypothetical protein